MRPPIVGLLLAAAIGSLVSLTGCSDEAGTLDQAATERAVGRAVAAEVEPKVLGTTCPQEITAGAGATFTCKVRLAEAGLLEVDVRKLDDEGKLEVTPSAAVVTTGRIKKELAAALKEQFGRSFTVRCSGGPTEVRAPSSTSTCSARDKTSAREVTVTVTDAAGTLAFAVAPPD